MRIVPNTRVVYLPAPAAAATTSANAIATKADLDVGFRAKVAQVVGAMFKDHKIALSVVGPGWRRDFATQAAQKKTGAGPGSRLTSAEEAKRLKARWLDFVREHESEINRVQCPFCWRITKEYRSLSADGLKGGARSRQISGCETA